MIKSLYLTKFTYKLDKSKVFYKIGITKRVDISERFTITYPERVGYRDFDIDIIASTRCKDAKVHEKILLDRYQLMDINKYLDTSYTTKNLTGITEFRHIDDYQIQDIKDYISSLPTPQDDSNNYLTNYLGIEKYVINQKPKYIEVNGKKFDIQKLLNTRFYSDNPTHYRWPKSSWIKCVVSK